MSDDLASQSNDQDEPSSLDRLGDLIRKVVAVPKRDDKKGPKKS
jgi:hypothetical protein